MPSGLSLQALCGDPSRRPSPRAPAEGGGRRRAPGTAAGPVSTQADSCLPPYLILFVDPSGVQQATKIGTPLHVSTQPNRHVALSSRQAECESGRLIATRGQAAAGPTCRAPRITASIRLRSNRSSTSSMLRSSDRRPPAQRLHPLACPPRLSGQTGSSGLPSNSAR